MSFFRTVFALCTSFAAYRDVRDLPVTRAISHLLKLLTLLALVLNLSFIPTALRGTATLAERFDRDRAEFSIHEGQLRTAETAARYWGDDQLRFGLVPPGVTNAPAPAGLHGMVFHPDHFVFWTTLTNVSPPEVRQIENALAGLPDGHVDGEYFRRLMRWTLPVLLPVGWVLVTLVGTLAGLLQAYMFSLVGSLMERSLPGGLTFNQLLSVTLHAITPAAILVTVYSALQLPGLDLWLVYLIAFGVFLLGATSACRGGRPRPAAADAD